MNVTTRARHLAVFGVFLFAIPVYATAKDALRAAGVIEKEPLSPALAPGAAPVLRHEIIATHPHDARAFTQGLAILDGRVLEGTGQYGQSTLALKDLRSGAVLTRQALPARQFGEGVTVAGSRLIQLTWTSGVAWIYDLGLKRSGQFRYEGQGWGLAYDGQQLLMSDGSSRIAFRNTDTFELTGGIEVRDGAVPVRQLNELEYAEGWLYANVWQTDRIAVIQPRSGAVRGWIELTHLRNGMQKPAGWNEREHVLNGIAYNPANGHFYVTGKCWPVLFELKIERPSQATPSSLDQGRAQPQ